MSEIDARAIISPATRLGRCVRVSAYAVVGNEVELATFMCPVGASPDLQIVLVLNYAG